MVAEEAEVAAAAVTVREEGGKRERRGSEAANSPVVLLAEGGARAERGEGGGSEWEKRRMKQVMEGWREVRESLAPEESQGGVHHQD